MVLVVVGHDEALDLGDAACKQGVPRFPAGRVVVAAIDEDMSVAASRNQRARAVLNIENFKNHQTPPSESYTCPATASFGYIVRIVKILILHIESLFLRKIKD